MLRLLPALLCARLGGAGDVDVESAALASDDACLSAACALSALQKGAARAGGGAGAPEALPWATEGRGVCGGREGEAGRCTVRLFVGEGGVAAAASGAAAGAAALVQVLAAGQPIPTTDGLYPNTGCLEVFEAGIQLLQAQRRADPSLTLRVSPCKVGEGRQDFEVEPSKFRVLWDSGSDAKLCLTSFLRGGTTLVGFGACNPDIDSIDNFNQTFQFVGMSTGAVCQCRCARFGPCPIPCASNAACLHTQSGGPVQNIVLASPEHFWNRR